MSSKVAKLLAFFLLACHSANIYAQALHQAPSVWLPEATKLDKLPFRITPAPQNFTFEFVNYEELFKTGRAANDPKFDITKEHIKSTNLTLVGRALSSNSSQLAFQLITTGYGYSCGTTNFGNVVSTLSWPWECPGFRNDDLQREQDLINFDPNKSSLYGLLKGSGLKNQGLKTNQEWQKDNIKSNPDYQGIEQDIFNFSQGLGSSRTPIQQYFKIIENAPATYEDFYDYNQHLKNLQSDPYNDFVIFKERINPKKEYDIFDANGKLKENYYKLKKKRI